MDETTQGAPDERHVIRAGIVMGPNSRLVSVLFGLAVIAVGVLFTLDNLGLVNAGDVLRWWPALLLAYGLARLTGSCCRRSLVVGGFFTIIGAALLLRAASLLSFSIWDLWPVVLILIGANLLLRSFGRERWSAEMLPGWRGGIHRPPDESGSPTAAEVANAADGRSSRFSTLALLSKIERKIVSQNLSHGEATAVMGGQVLDLRSARLAGGTATIDLVVLLGGIDLYVPADWKVSVETVAMLGGYEDSTRAPAGESRGHLILKGVILMGGVEVRN
ncbi:MAG TPA: DUF5668 domain-containing protein [Terriglobales bacterium]|nr:DUF5668 domain-containing protein [Terriglobales bacterium]